jgi:hypothetical protein
MSSGGLDYYTVFNMALPLLVPLLLLLLLNLHPCC